MANFYALLVGIDNYPIAAHRLFGCINDANSMEQYLRSRFAQEDPSHIRVLRDGEAKREDVIRVFRDHLGQAGPGDTALFYYAGHGSQEQAPPEFWPIEPDHKNETVVCWDSRLEGGHDLADKELAKLIQTAGAKGANVAVVLDCCHSGSGTRAVLMDAAERRIPPDERPRPFTSYIPEAQQVPAQATRGLSGPSGWPTAGARHVLMSACRDDQTAKEYSPKGERHGAFTYFLLDALAGAPAGLSYRELSKQVSALVSANVVEQTPQLEAAEGSDLDRVFLGDAARSRPAFFTASVQKGAWVLDAGTVHGIPAPQGGEAAALALFPLDAGDAQLARPGAALATATVQSVTATSSALRIDDESKLDRGKTYKAVVTALPLAKLPVALEGDPPAVEQLKQAMAASLYVEPAAGAAQLRVLAGGGQFVIARPGSDRPIVAPASDTTAIVQSLEHIARWTALVNLANPATRLPQEKIRLAILKDKQTGEELQGADLRLEYTLDAAGKYTEPQVWVRVRNDSAQTVYCALLVLSEMFGVSTDLLAEGTSKLDPGQELWALNGDPVIAFVPQPLQALGATQSRDLIKLIVSDSAFDARSLVQGELERPADAARSAPAGPTRGAITNTLDRMLGRVSTRGLGARPDSGDRVSDFFTNLVSITTVRPREGRSISSTDRVELGSGVVIEPHPALAATARLTTVPQSRRDLGNFILPAIFRGDAGPDAPEMVQFTSSRGSDPGLSVLELLPTAGPIAHTAVTPEQPLRIHTGVPLSDDEEMLAFGFDGQYYVPLGWAAREGNETVVRLDRLPDPVADGTRSLGGSIKILFQKMSAKVTGAPFAYPILAAADPAGTGDVAYEQDPARVKQRVAAAKNIVVCVHGIIGDTRGIAAAVLAAKPDALVLTFDYENLNTTIEDNAALLKQRLAEAGLGPNHGKSLQIVAHSMGGLVSRWFIEQLGGNQVVEHLIMLGTPNAGSPWPTVEGYLNATVALVMNGLTAVAWPVKALVWVVRGARKMIRSLGEMQAGGEFLTSLAKTSDPAVRYTILAGNTKLIQPAQPGPAEPWYKALAAAAASGELLHKVLSVAFFAQPNDIAVSVDSATSVPATRKPAPAVQQTACDHITYFSTPAVVRTLWSALGFQAGAATA